MDHEAFLPSTQSSYANVIMETESLKREKKNKKIHLTMGAGFAPVTMQTRVKFWAS